MAVEIKQINDKFISYIFKAAKNCWRYSQKYKANDFDWNNVLIFHLLSKIGMCKKYWVLFLVDTWRVSFFQYHKSTNWHFWGVLFLLISICFFFCFLKRIWLWILAWKFECVYRFNSPDLASLNDLLLQFLQP